MKMDSNDMVSVSEAKDKLSSLVSAVEHEDKQFVVMKQNRVAAAVVGAATLDRLQRLDELEEDLRLLGLALARTTTDDGARHSLESVAAEFGVELED